MNKIVENKVVEEVKKAISDEEMEAITRVATFSDVLRVGSRVTTQNVGSWGAGNNACALSAARLGAGAVGYISAK